ncbi:MAG: putative signal transduction response regulator [Nitrososphaeraceae archaeon]|nr:putative signal transduction response regulator [Nitrososphaeraceae archaeon]
MSFTNINNKNILIVDDDVHTSSKYKKWLEEEGFNLTLINDPYVAEQNFNPENYDLVLIGFRMSIVDGFDLYHKLHEISKKVQQDTSSSNDFRICFMTSSRINYKALSEAHPEFGEECYVSKEVPKDVFIKHLHSLVSG